MTDEAPEQRCPKCSARLVHVSRRGLVLELCSDCGGTWFDAGELALLIELVPRFDPADPGEPTAIPCLRCGEELREHTFPGAGVLVDRCPACQGIWLDKGELELLLERLAAVTSQAHEARPASEAMLRAQQLVDDLQVARQEQSSCPKCKARLHHLRRRGMLIETCSGCQGLWFDAGELSILLELVPRFDPAVAGAPAGCRCLRCGAELHELPFPGTDVPVDRCPSCQGIWLDRGELERLRELTRSLVPEAAATLQERASVLLREVDDAHDLRRRCPRCEGALEDDSEGRVQVERCLACRGTWFDSGELTVVLGVSRRVRLKDGQPSPLRCLKCPDERLVALPYPGTSVEVDVCPDCRGTWVDGGELEALRAAL